MDKKKVIWTLIAVTMFGLAIYSTYVHQPEDYQNRSRLNSCVFCSIRNHSGIVGFATGACLMGTVYSYTNKK